MDPATPKEIIVKLWDLNTKDKKFQKKFASVFVQQDRKYVGMLIFNDESSHCKLLFNPYSKVKFTLKNMQNNKIYGTCSIVMRMLKDLKGKQSQFLPMNDETYDEFIPETDFKPNIELEYQWNPTPQKRGKMFDAGQNDSGLQAAIKELDRLIQELIELLNEQIGTDKEVNEDFLKYLEARIANQMQKIDEERQHALNLSNSCTQTLQSTEAVFSEYENADMETVQEIHTSVGQVQKLIALLETSSEEAKKRNLQIRKKLGNATKLTEEQKQERIADEELRLKKKAVIDSTLERILLLEQESLEKLNELTQNKGLHEAEEATKLFDEVLRLDAQITNPHAHDEELHLVQEQYDDRVRDIKVLDAQVGIYDSNLQNLDNEYSLHEKELADLKAKRKEQIRKNVELEKMMQELEEREEKAARELEEIRDKSVPIKDISLQTTRRISNRSLSKPRGAPKSMTINLSGGEIGIESEELEPEKLSSTLLGRKHGRDRARSDLGEGESKWKRKVNMLYEGVDELYTPSTREMDQRAQIHDLLDQLKDVRTRTEKLLALLDQINAEKDEIEKENLRRMKEELANRLNADELHIQKVRQAIRTTTEENKLKDQEIENHRAKIVSLTALFEKLLAERKFLQNRILILENKLVERENDEAARKQAYEESLKNSTKQKEIDEEIKKIRKQIAAVDQQIADLQAHIEDLEQDLLVIIEKINLKIKINRKRKEADKQAEYIPDRSDPADVKIAEYCNVDDTRVPIKRLAQHEYMFGRKKIFLTPDSSQAGGYAVQIPSEGKKISLDNLLGDYAVEEIKHLVKMRDDQQMVVGDKD